MKLAQQTAFMNSKFDNSREATLRFRKEKTMEHALQYQTEAQRKAGIKRVDKYHDKQ